MAEFQCDVIAIGLSPLQVPYLEALRELTSGRLFGIDRNPDAPGAAVVDEVHAADYADVSSVLRCLERWPVDRAWRLFSASSQLSLRALASIGERTGAPFPTVASIDVVLDKSLLYRSLRGSGLPIPRTINVSAPEGLSRAVSDFFASGSESVFVKSDWSKNPNYVFQIQDPSGLSSIDVTWVRDDRFHGTYVVQEAIEGASVRLNVLGQGVDDYVAFDFATGQRWPSNRTAGLVKYDFHRGVQDLISNFGLRRFIVKIDVIVDSGDNPLAVLDIGLDPPSRLQREAQSDSIHALDRFLQEYSYRFLVEDEGALLHR